MKKSIIGNVVTFTFKEGVESVVFDCSKMSATNQTYALPFAMGHRLGDNAATEKTEADRRAAVADLAAHYESGSVEWNMKGSTIPKQHPGILAMSIRLGKTYAETEQAIADDSLAALMAPAAAE